MTKKLRTSITSIFALIASTTFAGCLEENPDEELSSETEVHRDGLPCDLGECGVITSIDAGVQEFAYTGHHGAWMKDPLADEGAWSLTGYLGARVDIYADFDGIAHNEVIDHIDLPWGSRPGYAYGGTGHVVYGGFLYYVEYNGNGIIKLDLTTKQVVGRLELPGALVHNYAPYQIGAYTSIDLAADEQGLWAIYATDPVERNIVLSKLSDDGLAIEETWQTDRSKVDALNAWMTCGQLYVAYEGVVDYRYDTESSVGYTMDLPFVEEHPTHSMSYIAYNSREQRLYTWSISHNLGVRKTFQVNF